MRFVWGTIAFLVLMSASAFSQSYACDCDSSVYASVVDGSIYLDAYSQMDSGYFCDMAEEDCYQTASVSYDLTDSYGSVWSFGAADNRAPGYAELELWVPGSFTISDDAFNESAHHSVEGDYPDGSCYEWLDGNCVEGGYVDIWWEEDTSGSAFDPPWPPIGEFVRFLQMEPTTITKADFYQQLQSLYPLGTYDGSFVMEHNPGYGLLTGYDSCYWNGSGLGGGQYPAVQGSIWPPVGPASGFLHDQFGLDGVGFSYDAVNLIQTQAEVNDVSLPCDYTVYQAMAWSYSGDLGYPSSFWWTDYLPSPYYNITTC